MNQSDFFVLVCNHRGWLPTKWRIAVLNFWAWHEYADEDHNGNTELYDLAFNPLATTLNVPGGLQRVDKGFGPGNWNSVPVRMYATPEIGAQATADTLASDYYYHNINRCFADQRGYPDAVGPRDYTSWVGSVAYGQDVVNFMNACTESKTELFGEDEMTPEQSAQLAALPFRLSCFQVAAGDGDRMNYCYERATAAKLVPTVDLPTGNAPYPDVLNAYLVRRFNIIEAASKDEPEKLYRAMAA